MFKLTAYVTEYQAIGHALQASRRKIMVFLAAGKMIVLVMGTLMYVVEGPSNGFSNIPTSVYWAITAKTDLGRLMLLGWGTLAVPTGIVTAEMSHLSKMPTITRSCQDCLTEGYLPDANCYRHCGVVLPKCQRELQAPVVEATQ